MMNKKVQEYLKKLESEERQRLEIEKEKLAKLLDLAEIEYSPDNEYSDEYCEAEVINGEYRYCKKIPINLTDEEYELLMKTDKLKSISPTNRNGVAVLLMVLAILIWSGGLIAGFVVIDEFMFTLIVWGSAFLFGSLLLGFAETIKLLTAIKNK